MAVSSILTSTLSIMTFLSQQIQKQPRRTDYDLVDQNAIIKLLAKAREGF